MHLTREQLEARVAELEAEIVKLVAKCRRLEDAPKRARAARNSRKAWTTNPKAKGAK